MKVRSNYLFLSHVHTHNSSTWTNQFAENKAVYPSSRSKVKNTASLHSLRVDYTTPIIPASKIYTYLKIHGSLPILCYFSCKSG